MQGFNMGRYRPYDADPQKESFNARSGKHPLGNRARKLDQGALIVRFELPFNVWCESCGAHIGQGVRYNAEKRRVGEYYSTPIFNFRCKTACCQNWMEIQTDPKNTRYVVVSGAKQQNKEWDPAENGGFPILDDGTGGPSSLSVPEADPFSALEKSVQDQERAKTQRSRISELEIAATSRSADPYTLNSHLRSRFRKEKKERKKREAQDDALRLRIGWGSDKALVDNQSTEQVESDRQAWNEARRQSQSFGNNSASSRRGSSSRIRTSSNAASALAERLRATSRQKADPFHIRPS